MPNVIDIVRNSFRVFNGILIPLQTRGYAELPPSTVSATILANIDKLDGPLIKDDSFSI